MNPPYETIDTLFLDAGNTLVSLNFDLLAELFGAREVAVDVDSIRRAEAAARPRLSQWLSQGRSTETVDTFTHYAGEILDALHERRGPQLFGGRDRRLMANDLVEDLRARGPISAHWNWVLPGVREALAEFRQLGLSLIVVSNSDGHIERRLGEIGLAEAVDSIVDSGALGYEKPDPRIWQHACQVSGAEPARALHVGDLYHVDITGALAAGLHAALVDPFGDWNGIDCTTVADLTELAAHLRRSRRS